jgi:glycerol-3-phosphate acyltransferase PlsX
MHMVGQEMQQQDLSKEQQQLVGGVLRGVQHRFNPEKYGGAPLLGVAGNVLIGHGSSTPRAIERMILAAARLATQDVTHSISAVVEA